MKDERKAKELLETTSLSFSDISKITGLSNNSISELAKRYRPHAEKVVQGVKEVKTITHYPKTHYFTNYEGERVSAILRTPQEEKAFKMLQETLLNNKEISKETGADYDRVLQLGRMVRSKEMRRQVQVETGRKIQRQLAEEGYDVKKQLAEARAKRKQYLQREAEKAGVNYPEIEANKHIEDETPRKARRTRYGQGDRDKAILLSTTTFKQHDEITESTGVPKGSYSLIVNHALNGTHEWLDERYKNVFNTILAELKEKLDYFDPSDYTPTQLRRAFYQVVGKDRISAIKEQYLSPNTIKNEPTKEEKTIAPAKTAEVVATPKNAGFALQMSGEEVTTEEAIEKLHLAVDLLQKGKNISTLQTFNISIKS